MDRDRETETDSYKDKTTDRELDIESQGRETGERDEEETRQDGSQLFHISIRLQSNSPTRQTLTQDSRGIHKPNIDLVSSPTTRQTGSLSDNCARTSEESDMGLGGGQPRLGE